MAASWAMDMVGVIFSMMMPMAALMMPDMTMIMMGDASGPRKNREQSEKIDERFRFHNSIAVICFHFQFSQQAPSPLAPNGQWLHSTSASRFLLS